MFNADRIFAHRLLILLAFDVFEKEVNKTIKGEETIGNSTAESQKKLATINILRSELGDQAVLGADGQLDGTPMGDAIGAATLKDDDGTILTADRVEEMLRNVGIDAPFDHVTAWTLDQRKIVNAYRKARELWILKEGPEPTMPEIIAPAWEVRNEDAILDGALTEQEIETAVAIGPWGTRTNPDVDDEIQVFRNVDGEGEVTIQIREQTYGQLDRARLIAANLNLLAQSAHSIPAEEAEDAEDLQEMGDVLAEGETPLEWNASAATAEGEGTEGEESQEPDDAPKRGKKRMTHRKKGK